MRTDETRDVRRDAQTRRTILQAMAATGSVAALGGVSPVGAIDEHDEDDVEAMLEDVPQAGAFSEGETVGLQLVADGLAAPTDLDYVTIGEETRHVVVTQTGQIYSFDPDAATDDTANEADTDESEADDEAPADETDEEETADEEPDEDEGDEESADENEQSTEFVFNGVVAAWFGMEPEEIDGAENPTLELEAGETYTFTWENGDGQPHNVVILDAGDNILERTEIITEQGETQSLEFEATPEMERYVCEVHPGTMVGRIDVTDPDEEPPDEPNDVPTPAEMDLLLDIEDRLVSLGIGELGNYDERGLLGVAFHPNFDEDRRVFVRYSAPERDGLGYNHTDVLASFEADETLQVDPESEETIVEIPQPQDNHNGGRLGFGPEGYLYTSVGDGGNVHDIGIGHVQDWYDENEGGNAQDTMENLLGGILRIDVDEEGENGAYGIPDDNPLVGEEGQLEEFYAWGFRNPWGMSFDDDGRLFVCDAGQHVVESVYEVEQGGNYSWNVKEGSFCFSPETPLEPPAECPDEVGEGAGPGREGEALQDPIAEYRHMRVSTAFIDSSVVVGGHRYAGEAIPELDGAFVFGNWSSQGVAVADGEILMATEPDGEDEMWSLTELQFEGAEDDSLNRYVYSVERDADGELYVLANTDFRPFSPTGEIYRIVPADEGESVPAPEDPHVVDGPPEEEPDEDETDDEEAPPEDDEEPAEDDTDDGTEPDESPADDEGDE